MICAPLHPVMLATTSVVAFRRSAVMVPSAIWLAVMVRLAICVAVMVRLAICVAVMAAVQMLAPVIVAAAMLPPVIVAEATLVPVIVAEAICVPVIVPLVILLAAGWRFRLRRMRRREKWGYQLCARRSPCGRRFCASVAVWHIIQWIPKPQNR